MLLCVLFSWITNLSEYLCSCAISTLHQLVLYSKSGSRFNIQPPETQISPLWLLFLTRISFTISHKNVLINSYLFTVISPFSNSQTVGHYHLLLETHEELQHISVLFIGAPVSLSSLSFLEQHVKSISDAFLRCIVPVDITPHYQLLAF